MDSTTKRIVFAFASAIALWDVITTYSGLDSLTAGGVLPVILTIIINGILVFTYIDLDSKTQDGIHNLSKLVWAVAFIVDLVTSYTGNKRLMPPYYIDQPTSVYYTQIFIAAATAVFTSGSTVFVSYFVFKLKVLESEA